jgi:hypothetical protein
MLDGSTGSTSSSQQSGAALDPSAVAEAFLTDDWGWVLWNELRPFVLNPLRQKLGSADGTITSILAETE